MRGSHGKKIDFSKLDLQQALDLAISIEEEAKERYEEFSLQIGSSCEGDAGDFFVSMAKNETKHMLELQAQREKLFGGSPNRRKVTSSLLDEVRDIEAPDYNKVRSFMSKRHALTIALEAEVQAYNYYDKALSFVQNKDVKKLFIELRAEEVEHQNLIKEMLAQTSDCMAPEVEPCDVEEPIGL